MILKDFFRIKIGFKKDDIDYFGTSKERKSVPKKTWDNFLKDERKTKKSMQNQESFEVHGESTYYTNYYYDYKNKDNPLSPAYYIGYGSNSHKEKNVLVSDIALTAFKDDFGTLHVFANSILDGSAENNISISVYNFQNYLLEKKILKKGYVKFENLKNPVLIIAKNSKYESYLKLNNQIPLNNFDVGGKVLNKNLDAKIFMDKGVYRPGEDVHFSFVMLDKEHIVPDSYPLEFNFYNNHGVLLENKFITKGLNKFYMTTFKIPLSSETGNYKLTVEVEDNIFSKIIKVDNIIPNRLKINLDFKKTKLKKSSIIKIRASFFTGGKASNLNYSVNASFLKDSTTFENYNKFEFDDTLSRFSSKELKLAKGKLDKNGEASFKLNSDFKAPGILKLALETKVFENGGGYSSKNDFIKYSPYSTYAGIQFIDNEFKTGKDNILKVANLTEDGLSVKNSTLQVSFYKVGTWWWYYSLRDIAKILYYRSFSYTNKIWNCKY